MRKLRVNGWQRLGIIISLIWIPCAYVYTLNTMDENDSNFAVHVLRACEDNAEHGSGSQEACDNDYHLSTDLYFREDRKVAAVVALVPVPCAWLLVYVVIYLFKWVRRSFMQPSSVTLSEPVSISVPQDAYVRADNNSTSGTTRKENAGKRTFVGLLIVAFVTSGILGILSALESPVTAATWSRGLLATVGTFASPGVLIILGLTSWLVSHLAKTRPRSGWQKSWSYAKFFWKLYVATALILVVFPGLVALTNLARLPH
jgi:hypothetical protein